jgi:N-acetylglucosamine-6-phosphate deacetylase
MRKAVEFGIPLETAIKAASYNPAKSINMERVLLVICRV